MTFWWEMVRRLVVTSTLVLVICGYTQNTNKPNRIKRIDDLVEPQVYSKHDPPLRDGVTDVAIGIYINSFYAISEQTMDYSLSLYLRQSWSDPRLAYTPIDNKTDKVKLELAWQKMWVPDTFFRNEKKSGFHSVTVDNRMATITVNGSVWYVIKISSTLSCPMTLHKYPMDTQICPMTFESFGYTVDTVRLIWMEFPVEHPQEMVLPQFTYEGHRVHDCSRNYTSGTTSCLQIDFVLRRDLGYYFIQLFVPSVLIVILSWVSFWINVDAAPARVSLGLLTVLTMTNHSIGINTNLPRVSYVKAVDVWMSSCLLFVFAALCEYAFVNVASRRHRAILTKVSLSILFTLRRDIGYFMIQVYVPSILIVILSWVSFWINVDAAPARVSLGLLTVLTTTTQSSGINSSLPRVSYIKAIDVWMSVCLLFVFTALLEYAFVNVSMRGKENKHGRQVAATPARMVPSNHQRGQHFDAKGHRRDQVDKKQNNECSNCMPLSSPRSDRDESSALGGIIAQLAPPPKPTKAIDADGKARARGIDKIARKSFPLAFILFNIVYWVGYTYESK